MAVSRQDVIEAYHHILGREPESDKVILAQMQKDDVVELHRDLYGSEEYMKRHPGVKTFSRITNSGGVETIGVCEDVSLCSPEDSCEKLQELWHESVRQGKECLFLVDGEKRYLGKIVTKESLFARDDKEYFVDFSNYISIGEGDGWKNNVLEMWQAWKKAFPRIPFVPLVKKGVLIGMLFLLNRCEKMSKCEESMDIDCELFKLISKYGIYKEEPDLLDFSYEKYSREILNELVESLPKDGKIAFTGATDDSRAVFDRLTPDNRLKVAFVIDEEGRNLGPLTGIKYGECRWHNIHTVLVTTYNNREKIKKQLMDDLRRPLSEGRIKVRFVDVYDYLRRNGVVYRGAIPPCTEKFRACIYVDVNNSLFAYETAQTEEEKAFYLRQLIARCVDIRNFVYVEKYIKLYVKKGYKQKELFEIFLADLKKLLKRIKKKISERTAEDVIVNWVDYTNGKDFYQTKFAKSIENDALFLQRLIQTLLGHMIRMLTFFMADCLSVAKLIKSQNAIRIQAYF